MLITDRVMPHLGGDGLARRMRARYPGLQILYVSGYAPSEADVDGATDFLEKPFAPSVLMARVREVLGR